MSESHSPIVLAPRGEDNRFSQDSFVFDMLKHGYSILKKGRRGYGLPFETPDFVISHNPDDPDDSLFLKKFSATPSVVHLHYQFEYYQDQDNLALALDTARAAVVPTAFLAKKMSAKFPRLDWHVVSNGVRKHLFFPSRASERASFRRELGIFGHRKLIGFVGRLTKAKGLDILESICRKIEDVDADLLIQFPYWHNSIDPAERDRSLAMALSIREFAPNNIFIYPDSAPRFNPRPVRFLDALLMPSLSELQPMVVLEALASGVPVIGTRCTPFYDELEETAIESSACKFVDLPARFHEGCTSISQLFDHEIERVSRALLKLIESARPPSDMERLSLADSLPDEYVDGSMYSAWIQIYRRYMTRASARRTNVEDPALSAKHGDESCLRR